MVGTTSEKDFSSSKAEKQMKIEILNVWIGKEEEIKQDEDKRAKVCFSKYSTDMETMEKLTHWTVLLAVMARGTKKNGAHVPLYPARITTKQKVNKQVAWAKAESIRKFCALRVGIYNQHQHSDSKRYDFTGSQYTCPPPHVESDMCSKDCIGIKMYR